MKKTQAGFRVGRVRAYSRNQVWYLCYQEQGKRQRPRVGPDKKAARELAAQINAQLEVGAPSATGFDPIKIAELQRRWLEHHEHVLRSSMPTVNRYRTATEHLLKFVQSSRAPQSTSTFRVQHAEEFVRYLRTIEVAPNGHVNSRKRKLLDKGITYILTSCRTMFNYARKRRHLPPYTENPFSFLEIDRMPVENIKPISIFSPDQERRFLEACDDWQFPIFLTLLLTGMRPGELVHLLLPDDLDLDAGILRVRNKPWIGWQVKTRNEREIPLVQPLADVLRIVISSRQAGPVFLRRRFSSGSSPSLHGVAEAGMERVLHAKVAEREIQLGRPVSRSERLALARMVWSDVGALKTDRIRTEFMRLTKRIDVSQQTAPKVLRHLFATSLQDANVDPLIRNELMGHSRQSAGSGTGLGMTAHYTHTRPETRRRELDRALVERPAMEIASAWIRQRRRVPPDQCR